MQDSFTVTLNSKEAAILNDALRAAANRSYSLSRKATEVVITFNTKTGKYHAFKGKR